VGGTVTATVDGSTATPGTLVNGGSNCTVDPAGALVETLENNNACDTETVTVQPFAIFGDGFEDGVLPGPWGGATP
jgi:hypothetical protein